MEEKKEKVHHHKRPHTNHNHNNSNKERNGNQQNNERRPNVQNPEQSAKNNQHGYNRNKRHHPKHKRKPNPEMAAPVQNSPVQPAVPEETTAIPESDMISEAPVIETANDIPEAHAEQANEKSSVMVEVVGIRFKASGKTYYFDPSGISVCKGDYAIVETARGLEYGEVALANTKVSESDIVPPLRPIVRIATDADKAHNLENKKKEEEAFVLCNERILAHKLDMKLIDAQYTFDNTKLLFYFTSAGRVDFRELVKDLASVFRTRIELRQIGIRDEAKLIGGLGMCGRPLCCSVFLSDFGQVSIKMAKEQNLSLNSAKISGICGRLMCCLRYEHETYEYEIKRTPPVDSTVKTPDGVGTVTEINPLAGTVKVRLSDKPDTPPKAYHRDTVTVISK